MTPKTLEQALRACFAKQPMTYRAALQDDVRSSTGWAKRAPVLVLTADATAVGKYG